MFKNEYDSLAKVSKNKVNFLEQNPFGYFLASCLAGIYVGFGIILIFTIGGLLNGQPYAKVVMGISFGIALSLVVMAGSELFTGNNLIMGAGSIKGEVPWSKTIKLWVVCYVGNWVGAFLLGIVYILTGLSNGPIGEFFASVTLTKTTTPISELFFRGVLCNVLVCLAIWCFFKLQSESGKLIMIFWCLFAFITSGFEHSIANMTALTVGLLQPMGQAITVGGYFTNILVVTLGNMVGAFLFLVIPYYIMQKKD
ncbi:MAG: formate/nitrite transporter family protein [Lachnospirales bacterium]